MISLSPLCSNTLQIMGATSGHGTWTVSEWFCLQAQSASCLHLRTRHSYTHLPLHPGFRGRKAQVHSWDESCSMIQQVLISAPREPPPPRCYIMSYHEECGKVHCPRFCTCQCQPKIETVKYHGSSCCSALCIQNSETKIMLRKIWARVLLCLCSKKAEKQKNSHPHC